MSDIVKSFVVLLISVILVHLAYIGYVRPEAELLLEAAKQASQTTPRELVIVLKDYEQEICIILMFWGSFLILSKCRKILHSKYLYTVDVIEEIKGGDFEPEQVIKRLDAELSADHSSAPLIQTLRTTLWRYAGTKNVQNLSDAIESCVEALAVLARNLLP